MSAPRAVSASPQAGRCLRLAVAGMAAFVLALVVWAAPGQCLAQDDSPEAGLDDSTDASQSLDGSQDAVAIRYRRFEKTLLQMAELMRKTDPDRAELLVRAIGRSKEDRVVQQMDQIVQLLQSDKLGDATDQQGDLIASLSGILQLLQSEDRQDWLEKEEERIKDLLKDVERLKNQEMATRSRTERRENSGKLADEQKRIAKNAQDLSDKIDRQDRERNAESDNEKRAQQDQNEDQSKSQEQEDASDSQQDGKRGESGKPSEKSDKSKPGKSSQQQKQQGEQQSGEQQDQSGEQQGEQSESQQQQQQAEQQKRTPGREEIEQAKREMERAIEELKKDQHEKASQSQDKAVAELEKAKEALEEILRQLREEEREILLAALEARFQKMLAAQLLVYNGTMGLAGVSEEEWASRHNAKAVQLARDEDQIAMQAETTLGLLKEEGSSIAFPEVVEQLRDDMRRVARRLERSDVGELAQGTEKEIIETLEEIIEALQREMDKKDDRESPDQKQQDGPQELGLVDQLAELKMLRSLQMRVNRRTRLVGRMIEGEQATEPDLVDELRSLSARQLRIQEATYDLSVGKNK